MKKEIKVLIAEDEPPISRFVKKIVEEIPGFLVSAVCLNGEEGLKRIQADRPQVLITDIRMPGMTGLELIRKARENHPDMFCIVISGYKMFEYAREAIELETIAYILKPINQEELQKILLSVRSIWTGREAGRCREGLQAAFRKKDEEEWAMFLEGGELGLVAAYYAEENDKEELLRSAQSISPYIMWVEYRSWLLFPFPLPDMEPERDILFRRLPLVKRVRRTFACVCISAVPACEFRIVDIKDCVRRILPKLVIPGQCRSIRQDTFPPNFLIEQPKDEMLKKQIRIAVQAGDVKGIEKHFRNLCQLWERCQTDAAHIRETICGIAEQLKRSGMLRMESTVFAESVEDAIRSSDHIREICDKVCADLKNSLEEIRMEQAGAGKSEELFLQICRLIEGNLEKNYSLNEICDRFHVSQPYVRKVFKTFTDKTYREYVLQMKLETAKAMMDRNPAILVREVADSIGFDQLYFSTVFGKYMGMTPSQYRLRAQENREGENYVI